jgi:hypothetical protein
VQLGAGGKVFDREAGERTASTNLSAGDSD